jgi:hypothetical protein
MVVAQMLAVSKMHDVQLPRQYWRSSCILFNQVCLEIRPQTQTLLHFVVCRREMRGENRKLHVITAARWLQCSRSMTLARHLS